MEQIDLKKYVCHGLSGIRKQFKNHITYSGDEDTYTFVDAVTFNSDNVINAIQNEIENDDPYYDKKTKTVTGEGIVKKFLNVRYSKPEVLFGLYRLIQILKNKKIETFDDYKKRKNALIINEDKQIGDFNISEDLCFSMKDADFYPSTMNGISCDPGGSYKNYIMDAISIVLNYDEEFKNNVKSDKLDGVFKDELRIRGSINNPSIFAISIPFTEAFNHAKNDSNERARIFEFWEKMVHFIRAILNKYGYNNVYIVDSCEGYNLENKDIINAYNNAAFRVYEENTYHQEFAKYLKNQVENAIGER